MLPDEQNLVDLLVKFYSWIYAENTWYRNSERKMYLLGFAWQSNERLLLKATERYLPTYIHAWYLLIVVSNDCVEVRLLSIKRWLFRGVDIWDLGLNVRTFVGGGGGRKLLTSVWNMCCGSKRIIQDVLYSLVGILSVASVVL